MNKTLHVAECDRCHRMPGRNSYRYRSVWGGWRWSEPLEFEFPPVPEVS